MRAGAGPQESLFVFACAFAITVVPLCDTGAHAQGQDRKVTVLPVATVRAERQAIEKTRDFVAGWMRSSGWK